MGFVSLEMVVFTAGTTWPAFFTLWKALDVILRESVKES